MMSRIILATLLASTVSCGKVQSPMEDKEARMGWFNRHPEYLKRVEAMKDSNDEIPPPPTDRGLAADPKACAARLDRFKQIDKTAAPTKLTNGDPEFPNQGISIAEAGANCGDSAAGINDPCDKYNHWSDMASITQAQYGTTTWTVFGPGGMPSPSDVQQGAMGNCYFLAAIISIAHMHPDIIKNMFVRTNLWTENTITTKWLINGMESMIEVDTAIPARPEAAWKKQPYFVAPVSASKAWWPAILEKSWAKLFGSYHATEAGRWSNAAAAITRAPTIDYFHKSTDENTLWAKLVEGTANKWPMGAGTDSSHFGLAAGHAYAVLEAIDDSQEGKIVKVRNPWHADHYKGALPNPVTNDGLFTMKLSEYHQAFSETSIAKVYASYHVTTSELVSSASLEAGFKFTTTQASPFYVSVVWPSARMLSPCVAKPNYNVLIEKIGGTNAIAPSRKLSNAAVVAVDGASAVGSYRLAVSIKFASNSFIQSAYMTIYAKETVTLYTSTIPYPKMALGMVGGNVGSNPCDTVTISGSIWTANYAKTYGGVATYWSGDYFYAFSSREGKWIKYSASAFDQLLTSDGYGMSYWQPKIGQSDIKCGCHDSPSGVSGFSGISCSQVKAPNFAASNVRCDVTVQYTDTVRNSCPVTCGGVAACSTALPQALEINPAPAPTPGISGPAPAIPGPTPAPTTVAPTTAPAPATTLATTAAVTTAAPTPATTAPAPATTLATTAAPKGTTPAATEASTAAPAVTTAGPTAPAPTPATTAPAPATTLATDTTPAATEAPTVAPEVTTPGPTAPAPTPDPTQPPPPATTAAPTAAGPTTAAPPDTPPTTAAPIPHSVTWDIQLSESDTTWAAASWAVLAAALKKAISEIFNVEISRITLTSPWGNGRRLQSAGNVVQATISNDGTKVDPDPTGTATSLQNNVNTQLGGAHQLGNVAVTVNPATTAAPTIAAPTTAAPSPTTAAPAAPTPANPCAIVTTVTTTPATNPCATGAPAVTATTTPAVTATTTPAPANPCATATPAPASPCATGAPAKFAAQKVSDAEKKGPSFMQGAPITIGLFSVLFVAAVVGMIARVRRGARPNVTRNLELFAGDERRASNYNQMYTAVLDADVESHEPCLE